MLSFLCCLLVFSGLLLVFLGWAIRDVGHREQMQVVRANIDQLMDVIESLREENRQLKDH